MKFPKTFFVSFKFAIVLSNIAYSQPITSIAAPPEWQTLMYQPNADFYAITQSVENFYAANPQLANTNEGGALNEFQRWKWFWQDRVTQANQPIGSFLYYHNAVLSLQQNPICNGTSAVSSDWQQLGPVVMASQTMGAVFAVAVDPNNSDIVYAGSGSSGLWKNTEEHELYLYNHDERIETLEKTLVEQKKLIEKLEAKIELLEKK